MTINKNKWFKGDEELTNHQHHNETTGFSSSSLKAILSDSPRYFYNKYILNRKVEEEDNEAFEIGTIIHEAVLEPHKYAVNAVFTEKGQKTTREEPIVTELSDEKPKKVKVQSKSSLVYLKENQYAVNPKLKYVIEQAVENIKNNPRLQKLIEDGDKEITGTAHHKGINYKIRPDCKSGDYIIDVKTTTSLKSHSLINSIITYYYIFQAAFYLTICKLIDGKNAPTKFMWVFINKNNGEILCVEASEEMIQAGNIQVKRAITALRLGLETHNWPSRDSINGAVTLKLPYYFNPNED